MDQNNQQNTQQVKIPQNDYTKMDEKTIATIKASAIWGAVTGAIISVVGMLVAYYFFRNLYSNMMGSYGQYLNGYLGQAYKPQLINVGTLLNDVIWAVVGGAVAGWIIAKFYPVFVGWQKKFVNNKLNSFFKLLFWPSAIGFVLSLIVTGALSAGFSTAFVIVIVVNIGVAYLYAKMMDKAVGKYYK